MEKFPSVQTSFGSISSILRWRNGLQASISSGCGSRLPGGRDWSTFAMNTSSRDMPISSRSFVSSWPARPTNGSPCWSSCMPGASPTNIRPASALPEPNTTFVRVFDSGQRAHAWASR